MVLRTALLSRSMTSPTIATPPPDTAVRALLTELNLSHLIEVFAKHEVDDADMLAQHAKEQTAAVVADQNIALKKAEEASGVNELIEESKKNASQVEKANTSEAAAAGHVPRAARAAEGATPASKPPARHEPVFSRVARPVAGGEHEQAPEDG